MSRPLTSAKLNLPTCGLELSPEFLLMTKNRTTSIPGIRGNTAEGWESVHFKWDWKPSEMVDTGSRGQLPWAQAPRPRPLAFPNSKGTWAKANPVLLSGAEGKPQTLSTPNGLGTCWDHKKARTTLSVSSPRSPTPMCLECCFVFPTSSPHSRNPVTWPCGIQNPAKACHIAATWKFLFIFEPSLEGRVLPLSCSPRSTAPLTECLLGDKHHSMLLTRAHATGDKTGPEKYSLFFEH